MERSTNKKTQIIVVIGLMSAMVFALSGIRIPIGTIGAIHLGNIMCILSGLLFGGLKGGLSSGLGSMFYDFTNPLYIAESPITFANKFMMGFVAGTLNVKLKIKNIYIKAVIAAICGQITYIILYLTKNVLFDVFFKGDAYETVLISLGTRITTSSINAVIAISCAVPLYAVLRNIIIRTPFKNMLKI